VNKTFGILAHVDAGKTTFSEQVLFRAHALRKMGRVDHKDAYLDALRSRGQRILAQHRPVRSLTAEIPEDTARQMRPGDVCAVTDDVLGIQTQALCTARTVSGDGESLRYAVTVRMLNS